MEFRTFGREKGRFSGFGLRFCLHSQPAINHHSHNYPSFIVCQKPLPPFIYRFVTGHANTLLYSIIHTALLLVVNKAIDNGTRTERWMVLPSVGVLGCVSNADLAAIPLSPKLGRMGIIQIPIHSQPRYFPFFAITPIFLLKIHKNFRVN